MTFRFGEMGSTLRGFQSAMNEDEKAVSTTTKIYNDQGPIKE
jgi:Sec-independent protein translocase protein TatA